MKTSIHTYFLYLAVACLLALVLGSCSMLKRMARVGGPAAGGALAGGILGGPAGAAAGGAAGAVAGDAMGENSELRSGELKGEEAYVKEIERLRLALANRPVLEVATPTPFIPRWIWFAAIGALLWLKGHHLLALMNGGGLSRLLNVVLPSWMQNKLTISQPKG